MDFITKAFEIRGEGRVPTTEDLQAEIEALKEELETLRNA